MRSMVAAKTKARGGRRTAAAVAETATVARAPEVDTSAHLAAALERAFGMTPDDAAEVAAIVAERFQGCEEVNDETIDAEVRSLFYTLEGRRLLSFRRVEYDNEQGEKRRAFWWRIRLDVVAQMAEDPAEHEEDVYATLPAECWRREAGEA